MRQSAKRAAFYPAESGSNSADETRRQLLTVQAPLILKYASIAYRTMAFPFLGQIACLVADIPLIQEHHL